MTTNRQLWKEHISTEYKQIPPFIVDWLLDIYEQNPDWFAQQMKQDKLKGRKAKQTIKQSLDTLNEAGAKPEVYEVKSVKIVEGEYKATKIPTKVSFD